ncbi:MAG: ECF transporter S component [Candidatus Bathyarchaeia archaeon]
MGSNLKPKTIAMTAVMTALVYVTTSISVKMPPPLGAWHLGDVGSFVSAIMFGPIVGAFSCGVGAMLFDVWNPLWGSAFISWAPATILIRGVMGYILGRYRNLIRGNIFLSNIAIMALSHIWKNLGYFAYDYYMRGAAAWIDIYTFFPLTAISIAITVPILKAIRSVYNTNYIMGGESN